MPLYTTDALILRTYKLGESDRIVVFLTRDRGKKRGVAKNARQSRRRFGGALEPLTCGRVGYRRARAARAGAASHYVEPLRSPLSAVDGEALGYVELLRRADRRVGAGGRSERNAVPARRVDGRGDGGRRADRAAGALLRVLAAAAAGRLRGRPAAVGRGARRFWRRRARAARSRWATSTVSRARRCASSKRRIAR